MKDKLWYRYEDKQPRYYQEVIVKGTDDRYQFSAYYGWDENSGDNWIGTGTVRETYKDLCFRCQPEDEWCEISVPD